MLKEVGMSNLRLGVQSGSDHIRTKFFNRKDSLDDILNVAWLLFENKVVGLYDFIVNNPYDNFYTTKETRDFIDKLPPLSGINCFELRWFPKTPLTERALGDGTIEQKDVEGQYNRFGGWNYCYMKG